MDKNKTFKFHILNTDNYENKVLYVQDEKLSHLHKSVKNILNISQEIHDELLLQSKINENLEESIETTTTSINKTEKKTANMIKKCNNWLKKKIINDQC